MSESCEDGEPVRVHSTTVRKARKSHTCCACKSTIQPSHYYALITVIYGGGVETFKRCGACQKTHEHLRELCVKFNKENGEMFYPLEALDCGLEYEDEWGDVPDGIAALAFMTDDERGALLSIPRLHAPAKGS